MSSRNELEKSRTQNFSIILQTNSSKICSMHTSLQSEKCWKRNENFVKKENENFKKNIKWLYNNFRISLIEISLIVKWFEFRNFTSFFLFWNKYNLKYRKSVQLWILRIFCLSQNLLFQNLRIRNDRHSKSISFTSFRLF